MLQSAYAGKTLIVPNRRIDKGDWIKAPVTPLNEDSYASTHLPLAYGGEMHTAYAGIAPFPMSHGESGDWSFYGTTQLSFGGISTFE